MTSFLTRLTEIAETMHDVEKSLVLIPDDRDDFEEVFGRISSLSIQEYLEFLDQRQQTDFGQAWAAFRRTIFELVTMYLSSPEIGRKQIRDIVVSKPMIRDCIPTLIEEQSWLIRVPSDVDLLEKLVGLLSLADVGSDSGLAIRTVLTDLWHQAQRASIDIEATVRKVALVSNSIPQKSGGLSTRDFLLNFRPAIRGA